jgi:nicotinamidase-related amidase
MIVTEKPATTFGVAPPAPATTHFLSLKENVMPDSTRPYEPLTSENAALVLIDHQVGLMTGVRDYSTGELKHNVVALAKAAKALKLPIIVTTTARDSMWGPTFPELVEALPGVPIIDRSSVNAFDDPKVPQAITVTGRKKLIFAGISLEVCAAFPAITAVGKGLDAYVVVDASGTFSETKRQVGLLRMLQAGVILSDYATLMVEILKDNGASATPEAKARTRAFARVIGPFLVIVPGIIVVRAPEMDTSVSAFFENGALVWIVGGLLLFGGLLIIAHHQYWSSAAAILISLFGWFLALRGLALLAAPQLYQRAAASSVGALSLVRIGFGALVLNGLWLTFVGWIAKPPIQNTSPHSNGKV